MKQGLRDALSITWFAILGVFVFIGYQPSVRELGVAIAGSVLATVMGVIRD